MSTWHAIFVALLALDGVQLACAAAAVVHGRRRSARGEAALAAYSYRHAALLAAGAATLAVPLALGLADVWSAWTAIVVVFCAELAGALGARLVLERLHRAAHA